MQPRSALIAYLERRRPLAPFQRRFLRGSFRPGVFLSVLSGPRGLGKSSIAADILSAYLAPDGPLHRPGAESILLASSLDQARITFRFLRAALTGDDYRWLDSGQRVGVTHVPTDTRVRVASSDAKKAFGLGSDTPAIVGDEPGAWQERGGALMFDALETSGGKSDTRLFLIGTRAPGADGGWWRTLLEAEPDPSVYRQVHDAPVDDDGQVIAPLSWKTIRRAQPLLGWNPFLRPKLEAELRKARKNETDRRRFITYRINRPVQAPQSVLFTVAAWQQIEARPVPPADGQPIIGIDTGSTRSWSTACILWRNGRADAFGLTPGVPSLADQEKRDAKRAGEYQELVDRGVLEVEDNLRVVQTSTLIERVMRFDPAVIVCDNHRLPEVLDAVQGRCPVVNRRTRWSESTFDIQATREVGLDGKLSIVPTARQIYRVSLRDSAVQEDDDNSVKLVKAKEIRSRDDLSSALVRACGALKRSPDDDGPGYAIC